jgi:hypothetical protein
MNLCLMWVKLMTAVKDTLEVLMSKFICKGKHRDELLKRLMASCNSGS